MRMLYNVVVEDEATNEVDIIARSFEEQPTLNYVNNNRRNYAPAKLYATRIRADALRNPFKNCIQLK